MLPRWKERTLASSSCQQLLIPQPALGQRLRYSSSPRENMATKTTVGEWLLLSDLSVCHLEGLARFSSGLENGRCIRDVFSCWGLHCTTPGTSYAHYWSVRDLAVMHSGWIILPKLGSLVVSTTLKNNENILYSQIGSSPQVGVKNGENRK